MPWVRPCTPHATVTHKGDAGATPGLLLLQHSDGWLAYHTFPASHFLSCFLPPVIIISPGYGASNTCLLPSTLSPLIFFFPSIQILHSQTVKCSCDDMHASLKPLSDWLKHSVFSPNHHTFAVISGSDQAAGQQLQSAQLRCRFRIRIWRIRRYG